MIRLLGWLLVADHDVDADGRTRYIDPLAPLIVPVNLRTQTKPGEMAELVLPKLVLAVHLVSQPAPTRTPKAVLKMTRDEVKQPLSIFGADLGSWPIGEASHDLALRLEDVKIPFSKSGPLKFHLEIDGKEVGVPQLPIVWEDEV